MDDQGQDLETYISNKFGPQGLQMVRNPNAHIYQSGRAVGIEFLRQRNVVPTQRAHALVEYVKEKEGNERANAFMEVLFHQYFEKGENINSINTLLDLVQPFVSSLPDPSVLEERRSNVEGKDLAYKRGIRGVPYFSIEQEGDRPVQFSGAQPVDLMVEVLEEAADV